jgi:Protein of unknown function (DUF3352)
MTDAPEPQPRISRRSAVAGGLGLVVIAVIVIALIAGGGSSHGTGTAADPAGVIPASAPLYAGAVVRPEGSLQTAAAAAGHTLTHQPDPYLRLVTALQTAGSAPLNFNHDIAPWLGQNAGIFLSSLAASGQAGVEQVLSLLAGALLSGSPSTSAFPFATHGVPGAIVMDTSDVEKARSFLESQARRAGAHAGSYRGVTYQITPAGVAFGIVERFAVIGSEEGLHGVIDTTLGGSSLAKAPGYAKLLAHAPAGTLAHVYVHPGTAATSSAPSGLAGLLGSLAGTRETNISLVPSKTSIALDADASGPQAASGGLLSSAAEGAKAAGELPGESWLAVGLGHVGPTLGKDVQALRGLTTLASSLGGAAAGAEPTTPLTLEGLLKTVFAPLSVLGGESAQAKHDFQSWMGSAGIFAAGTGLVELKAGVVISSTDPAASRAAVDELANTLKKSSGASLTPVSIPGTEAAIGVILSGFPVTLNIAAGRGADGQAKFVIGLSEASVSAALQPPSTVTGGASYTAASAALGEGIQPSLLLDVPTFLGLIEGVDLTSEPIISKFIPYLRTLTAVAGGGKNLSEEIQRFRVVFGLQKTE